jgi:PAS domain S-box-containing protein
MIRVLHVDDEQSFLEVASHFLQKVGGLEVHCAVSVRSAMNMVSETTFDVIVSDYQMPETDGIEFLRMLRAGGSDIPFILFTGKGREDVVIDALNQGADYYLQKGGDLRSQFHELANMISRAAEGRRSSIELIESQERFRRLADSISDTLIGLDDDFRVTFWNRAAAEVIGVAKEDAVGSVVFDLIPTIKGTSTEDEIRGAATSRSRRTSVLDIELRGEHRSFGLGVYPGEEGLLVFARDITATKRAAQELAESEGRYKALVETLPDAIIVFAIDTILYVNPAALRVYGAESEEDVIGKRIFDLIPPEFASETAARVRKMYEAGVAMPARSMQIFTKSGQRIDMEASSTPITFMGKKAIQTVLRDVTERKRAEEAILARQEELRTILDSVRAMICFQDIEGRFVRVNKPFAEATGVDEMHWRGRKAEEVLPGLGEIFSARDKQVIETGRPLTSVLTPYQAKMGVRWALTDKIPYVNGAGEVIGVITVAEDITERRSAEELTSRIEGQLEYLLSESSAVTYSCSVEEPFDATYVSSNIKRTYGYEKGYHIHEYRWKKGDGTYVWVHDEVRLLRDEQGVPTQLVGLWLDISQQKKAEEGLRNVNKKLNLLGGITRHDSLNQLTALKSWLALAIEKESDDSVRDMLLKVDKAADSLKMHMDFTAQYKNLGMKRPQWMPLAEVVAKVTEGLGRQGISVSVDVGDTAVFADPMLENVFRNLVNNSISHGGTVDRISISCEEAGDAVRIVYEDNGVGIPLESKEKIFERGYGKRHGYGLYLSQEILSITDMTLKETGVPEEGARFEILVPPGNHARQSE